MSAGITITERATEKVHQLMSEEKMGPDYFVRVSVKGGGCSGLSYDLDFDNERKESDQEFPHGDIKIICDLKSYLYLAGTELDFTDGLNGKGFNFVNPNAKELAGAEKALQYNTTQNIKLIKKSGLVLIFFVFSTSILQSQTHNYQLRKGIDIGIVAGSSALFTSCYLLQKKVKPLVPVTIVNLNRQSINKFDRIATYQWNPTIAKASDGLAIGSVLMQSYFYFNKSTRAESFKIGVVAFESLMVSQSIANALKLTTRNRPYLYNPLVPMSEKQKADSRMSFFSAHTTSVASMCFSFAYTHQTYLPNSKYNKAIWVSAFTVPAIEGFLRVKAGKHYPTDVITGYLVGLGTSFLMHQLHKN